MGVDKQMVAQLPPCTWDIQVQPFLYKVVKVLTDQKPYCYVLQNLKDQSRVPSYFSGSEMVWPS